MNEPSGSAKNDIGRSCFSVSYYESLETIKKNLVSNLSSTLSEMYGDTELLWGYC